MMKWNKGYIKSKVKKIALASFAVIQMMTAVSYATMIDESSYEIAVSRGISHKRIVQTFENGVQSIYLTVADLSDPALGLDLLYNKNTGFIDRQELSVLAGQNPNAVVSINGDFFQTSKPSYSTGIMFEKGKMLSSPSYKNGEMASMILEGKNIVFDYVSSGVTMNDISNGQSYQSISVNKHSGTFAYPIVFTPEYRKTSIGSSEKLSLTEMIVEDSIVREIRDAQPAAPIPANGYVVVVSGAKANELKSKFTVGDIVSLSSSAEQVYNNMTTAIGGGTMILRNGQPTPITHQIKGRSQRTAVGVTYDNKLVFMVNDGRTGAYIGMTESDVANFLKTQNVRDAMMLDGGGSSELIINGKITNHLVGKERKLINGLALVNNESRGTLAKLEAVLETESIVQGDSVKLIVQGFDHSMNPVKLGAITVTGSGVDVSYNNGTITARSGGSGVLNISSGGASTTLPITVTGIDMKDPDLSEPNGVMDFAIISNGSSDKNDVLGQVLNAKVVERSAGAKVAVNMFNKNHELSNSLKGTKESIHQSGQRLSSNGATFLGLSISKGIGGTSGQWTALKNALSSGDKDVVILFNGKFELDPAEKKIFRKLVNEASTTKNIYVVSYGNGFSSYAEGSVSYISIIDNAVAKGNADTDYRMLSFRRQNGKLIYSFEKLF